MRGLLLSILLAAPAAAGPYYDLTIDTTTGMATQKVSGSIQVAVSSTSSNTATITLSGTLGGLFSGRALRVSSANFTLDGSGATLTLPAGSINNVLTLGDMGCNDGYILKWNDGAGTWGCTVDGGTGFATLTDTQTFSGRNTFTNPALAPNTVGAYAVINGTGTAWILQSYNVASLTDNGNGDYTITFSTPMSTANYAASCMCASVGTLSMICTYRTTSPTAGAIRVGCIDLANDLASDPLLLSVIVFGQ